MNATYFFSALLGMIPMLAVLVAGFIVVARFRARLGRRAALLANVGLALLTAREILVMLWGSATLRLFQTGSLGVASYQSLALLAQIIFLMFNVAGLGLLIAALVTRARDEAPAEPTPYAPAQLSPEQHGDAWKQPGGHPGF